MNVEPFISPKINRKLLHKADFFGVQFSTAERVIMANSMGDPHEIKNRTSITQESHVWYLAKVDN